MSNNSKNTEAMEEMIAHHEQTIEELSKQLAKQWIAISTLENKVITLTKRFVTIEQNTLPDPHTTIPPHY